MTPNELAAAIKAAGLSHAEAARRIGIAERSLRRALSGERTLSINPAEIERRLKDPRDIRRAGSEIDTYNRLGRLADRVFLRAAVLASVGDSAAANRAYGRHSYLLAHQRGSANAILGNFFVTLVAISAHAKSRGLHRTQDAIDRAISAFYIDVGEKA